MRLKGAELKRVTEVTPPGFGRKGEVEITLSTTGLSRKEIDRLFDTRPSEKFDVTIKDSKK